MPPRHKDERRHTGPRKLSPRNRPENPMHRPLAFAALIAAAVGVAASSAHAQFVTYYSPVVTATVLPLPAPVATVVARPVVTVAASPVPTVAYSPVIPSAPIAATPAPVAPAPTVAYRPVVAPAAVATPVVTSVPVYRTRWRPLLGGTVTTVRYRPVVTTAVVPAF